MQLICLTQLAEIEDSQKPWDDLAGHHPFFNWNWLHNWYRSLADSDSIRVVVIEDQGRWIGLMPMSIETSRRGRCLRFASQGAACADYVGPLIRPGYESSVSPLLFNWLQTTLDESDPAIDYIELDGFAWHESQTADLLKRFARDGYCVSTKPIEGCWNARLPQRWESFQASVSKSFRRKIKKSVSRIESDEFEIVVANQEADWETLWPEFVRLHQLRRQELGQPGCFADKSFEAFLSDTVRSMMADQQAVLVGVKYRGRFFAAMLLLLGDDTTYMYQSGSDPELKHLEPGHLLGTIGIRLAIERGHANFDFLRGDEPYKSRWLTQRVELGNAKIVNRRLNSRLKHQIWESGSAIKSWVGSTILK